MLTGVSATTAMRGARFWIRVAQCAAALMVVAAGIFALWYRGTYNVWPGQQASTRIHWCGRDYESFAGTPQTRQQISSREHFLIRPVGQYPLLAWSPQRLFAAVVTEPRGNLSARRHFARWWSTCAPAPISIRRTA